MVEKNEAKQRVLAVLRAHGTPDPFDDLVAHMKAVKLGGDILPIIRESILGIDWSTPKPPGKVGALTALMLVAHDVDELSARDISVELAAAQKCHPVFLHRLSSINRFTLGDYNHDGYLDLKLFVAKGIGKPSRVFNRLKTWLSHVPDRDLSGISRIYVIEETEQTYWGQYLMILSKIALVWQGWNSQTLRQRLATEFTLYHEIGHHVHRNRRCERPESEALADSYAFDRFGEAHPFIGPGIRGAITIALTAVRARGMHGEFA